MTLINNIQMHPKWFAESQLSPSASDFLSPPCQLSDLKIMSESPGSTVRLTVEGWGQVLRSWQPLPPVCPPNVCPMRLWCFMDLENLYWLENVRLLLFWKGNQTLEVLLVPAGNQLHFKNKIPSTGCRWYFTCGLWNPWTWKSLSDVETQNHWRAINLPNLRRWDRSCVNGLTSHHGVCVWRCQLFHQCVCQLACIRLKGPMLCPLRLK